MKLLLILSLVVSAVLAGKPGPPRPPQNLPRCPTGKISPTTASGKVAPTGPFCSGQLIFEENFNELDFDVWQHENTLAGGGNWEFQWYTNNRSNSYCEDGVLYIRPTLTEEAQYEGFVSSGTINVGGGAPADQCTNPAFYGCERMGTPDNIINPIKSARLRLVESFNFKYGKVEVRAKIPSGDWLWPAIWFLPKKNVYGIWPASGEIDLLESRGNLNLKQDGVNIGVEQVGSTLHYGPFWPVNGYMEATMSKNSPPAEGYHKDFHNYQLKWTPTSITFGIDDVDTGTISVDKGFWERGLFDKKTPGLDNPWRHATKMAPFDQEFYLVMNLAVGGVNYFKDEAVNTPYEKPWKNSSPNPQTAFWNAREKWLPTWNLKENYSKGASLQVDHVKIWAI